MNHFSRTLEIEVGCRLLIRLGKKMRFTVEGEAFLCYTPLGLDALAKAPQSLKEFKSRTHQNLRAGTGASICRRLLTRVLEVIRQEYLSFSAMRPLLVPGRLRASLEKGR